MSENKSGDSVLFTHTVTEKTAEELKASLSNKETENLKPKEKGETASTATNESQKASDKTEETTNSTDEEALSRIDKLEKSLHYKQLNLIENVLDTYSPEKAREFFEENEDVAEVANRSKRLKERYRSLMDNKESETKTIPAVKKAVSEETAEEAIDENSLSDRIYLNTIRREKESYQKQSSREFAERNGLNVDDFNVLHSTAVAIEKATGQAFESCLEGAIVSLKGSKTKTTGINVPASMGASPTAKTQEIEVNRIMKAYGVDRGRAEKLVAQAGTYTGALDERISL